MNIRNCWVRDIADYAKYGILRRLALSDLRLGVVWYLTAHMPPNEPQTGYLLHSGEYEAGDGDLFNRLLLLHRKGNPTVEDVAKNGILPTGTLFHDDVLATSQLDRHDRQQSRADWFLVGQNKTEKANLVLLDPDTGLLPPRRNILNKGGEEYATNEEV